jgi:acylphosphatase
MSGEPGPKTVHLRIHGRVQGVGYRAWTAQKARKLGLAGWVRNVTDGTVESVVQGPQAAVDAMIAACQAGPTLARVTHVESEEKADAEIFSGFQQLPTAD